MTQFEKTFNCLNGPCEGAAVLAPADASPGTACALPWKNVNNKDRFAVYVLVDWNGTQGLMYLKSYHDPEHAARKVDRLTTICASQVS